MKRTTTVLVSSSNSNSRKGERERERYGRKTVEKTRKISIQLAAIRRQQRVEAGKKGMRLFLSMYYPIIACLLSSTPLFSPSSPFAVMAAAAAALVAIILHDPIQIINKRRRERPRRGYTACGGNHCRSDIVRRDRIFISDTICSSHW